MRVRWEPCGYEDLLEVSLQLQQFWQDVRDEIDPENEAQTAMLRDCARTLWSEDGKVLACVGITPLWRGVGTVWALLSWEALQHPIALTRGTVETVRRVVERDGIWRVQATCEHGHDAARRWLVWMGFSYEGTLRSYSHIGVDHDMYAKLIPRGTRGVVGWRKQPS